ncbi:MAG: serine hydrolase [Dehalococcoidia bacterium]
MTRLNRHPQFFRHLAFLAVLLMALGSAALARPAVLSAREGGGAPVRPSTSRSAPIEEAVPAPAVLVPAPAPVPARMIAWGPAPSLVPEAPPAPAIASDSAIVIDETSGVVLYEKDAHIRLPEASLTKIMTALLALERAHLEDQVEVTVDSRRMRGSTVMGLVPGERLTLEGLLYGLMLPSGNDAALAIAEHVSGSTDAFVALMNQRAAELGLVDTHFANPHGLDATSHYSSAFDLAVLTRVAMQRQDFREIVSTRYRVVTGALATYDLGTLNPLYSRLPGVDGVKTGYTRTARQTLVGSVTRDGHRVLVVVLRSPDRASDGAALFRWAFDTHTWSPPVATAAEGAVAPGAS